MIHSPHALMEHFASQFGCNIGLALVPGRRRQVIDPREIRPDDRPTTDGRGVVNTKACSVATSATDCSARSRSGVDILVGT